MATAKVTINDRVIMDITDTTATAATIREGYTAYGADGEKVTGTYTGATINNQNKTVAPTTSEQSVTYDSGYTGLGTVTVDAIPTISNSDYLIEISDQSFYTENDVRKFRLRPYITSTETGYLYFQRYRSKSGDYTVYPAVPSDTTITPTESSQTVGGKRYMMEDAVTVSAIPSDYVGSGITQRDSTDLSASGKTVTVPAGYYASQATKDISTGSVTAPSTITGTSATVGVNSSAGTVSLSKVVSVTPTVTTAGYISSGTAGDSTVTLHTSATYKAASTYTPTTTDQTIFSTGLHYFSGTQKIAGDADLVAGNIKQGVTIFGVEGTYSGAGVSLQTKSVNPTESQQEVTPDSGYDGLSKVTVAAIPSDYVGSGITRRSSSDLTSSGADVIVPAGYYENNSSGSVNTITLPTTLSATEFGTKVIDINPSETTRYLSIPAGYNLSRGFYTITGVSSTYVGSGITQRDGDDLTASGATVSVPAGYYAEAASKSVATGSAGTPTATKGTVSNHSILVTPSVTNTTGYITGGTKTGTAVTVSASELVSGTLTISSSGTKDVTNYASASVAAGSATAPASISGTTATVSTGTNTLTLTKTVSVTPSVTAGYVSSGTAGNSSVSLTANVTTKGAATITPTTSNQTIASGTYLTGTQTIAGDANLVGSNIISGKSIFGVSGTVVINKYYTGSSAPSSSLGNDGDIYLQN